MNCKKCGIEILTPQEQGLGLCSSCALKELAAKQVMDEVNSEIEQDEEYEPMFKPRYWVGSILSALGWFSLILGVFAIFLMIISKAELIIIVAYILGTLCVSGLWLGFSEIVRMLQNKAYD